MHFPCFRKICEKTSIQSYKNLEKPFLNLAGRLNVSHLIPYFRSIINIRRSGEGHDSSSGQLVQKTLSYLDDFDVLNKMTTASASFSDVMPCSLVET
jgi:hypothetical protein